MLITRTKLFGASIDEVDQTSTAIKLGKKNGGVCLGFRGFDPLKARPESAVFTAAFPEYSAPIAAHSHSICLHFFLSSFFLYNISIYINIFVFLERERESKGRGRRGEEAGEGRVFI